MYLRSSRLSILILLLFLTTNSIALAQNDSLSSNITLKTVLESDNVPLNKEVVYHVELSWEGDLDRYQIDEIVEPTVSGLNLRGSGSSNKLTNDKNAKPHSMRKVTYYFSPQSIGMAYIDGLTIRYKDNLTGDIETLISQRIGVKIIDPVISENDMTNMGTFFQWSLLIIFVLLAGYFGFRFFQRRKTENNEVEIIKSLEEKYLELMRETIHLANNATKENISSLNKLLNSYIAEKFSHVGTIDLSELKSKLENLGIAEDSITKIITMYEKSELARFAAEEINLSELHMYYDSIENILKEIDNNEKNNAGN